MPKKTMDELSPGTPVELLINVAGTIENDSGIRRNADALKAEIVFIHELIPTRRTSTAISRYGPSYSFTADRGTWVEYVAVPNDNKRAVSDTEMVPHSYLSRVAGGAPLADELYSIGEVLYLIKPHKFEARKAGAEMVDLQVGDRVKLLSKPKTETGMRKTTPFGTPAYYNFQPATPMDRTKVWRSDEHFSRESRIFRVVE